jgi:tyrosinase
VDDFGERVARLAAILRDLFSLRGRQSVETATFVCRSQVRVSVAEAPMARPEVAARRLTYRTQKEDPLRQRANILSLPLAEVAKVTAAFRSLKASGAYDDFVRRHMVAMNTPTPAGAESNAGHSGPIFLPWHRACLWELETMLINAAPAGTTPISGIPYWAWEAESRLTGGDSRKSKLWTPEYLGGDGNIGNGNRVLNGPFADWQALIWNNTTRTFSRRTAPGLIRLLGRDSAGSATLPTEAQITDLMTYTTYDRAPYNKSSTNSFRNRLEGWLGGPRLHNQVHRWVAGDMLVGTSPNDPVFWLHHANVDRLWWNWQCLSTPLRPYAPTNASAGTSYAGQRADDRMTALLWSGWTPNLVQDIAAVQDQQTTTSPGYQYL